MMLRTGRISAGRELTSEYVVEVRHKGKHIYDGRVVETDDEGYGTPVSAVRIAPYDQAGSKTWNEGLWLRLEDIDYENGWIAQVIIEGK